MRSDFHIPSAPKPTAKLSRIQNPKGQNPLRLPFASFRLIFRLEKTVQVSQIARQRLLTVPRATRPHEGYVPFAHNPTATQRESALNQVLVLGSPLNGR